MRTESLLEYVLRRLAETKGQHKTIAAASGVPYSTLTKIVQGVIGNPGINHIQALADYFQKVGAGDTAPDSILQKIKAQQRNFGCLPDGSPDPLKARAAAKVGVDTPAPATHQEAV